MSCLRSNPMGIEGQQIMESKTDYTELTSGLVAAYVSKNAVQSGDLPALIQDIHAALFTAVQAVATEPAEELVPAVSIKKSVTSDHLVCLEDGKKFKSLKRHIRTDHGLTPDEYRQRWNLPHDYPMVAPSYAAARSKLAKKMGLGRKPGQLVKKKSAKKRSAS